MPRHEGAPVSAVVMGDTDLLRPLGMSGVRAAVVAPPGSPVHRSKFAVGGLAASGGWEHADRIVDELVRFAENHLRAPVPLFYQFDRHLLLISRNRRRLGEWYRFVLPGEELVEDLVDKVRFADLARRLGLPVPTTTVLLPQTDLPSPDTLAFPVLLKPGVHLGDAWLQVEPDAKALVVQTPAELAELWPRLRAFGGPVLAQEVVPGPESRIESYHVYVDATGRVAAEFTGRKIRTHPAAFGYTTSLVITDAADVRELGRDVVERLGLVGVAKLDFKRAPDGSLRLLEVNPRFNLWHLPGAVAGVNLPAMVWADLCGRPRPPSVEPRPGVCWSNPWLDRAAARQSGVSGWSWMRWTVRCHSHHVLAVDDPWPLVHGLALRASRVAARRLKAVRGSAGGAPPTTAVLER